MSNECGNLAHDLADVCDHNGQGAPEHLPLQVLRNMEGFYLGTICNHCGPFARKSGYFGTDAAAEAALKTCGWIRPVHHHTAKEQTLMKAREFEPGDLAKHSSGMSHLDGYWFIIGKAIPIDDDGATGYPAARTRLSDHNQEIQTHWLDPQWIKRAHPLTEFLHKFSGA